MRSYRLMIQLEEADGKAFDKLHKQLSRDSYLSKSTLAAIFIKDGLKREAKKRA